MHKIYRLAAFWHNKIIRFAKDGEDFQELLQGFDTPEFDPESSPPNSIPISRIPQSGKENISGRSISDPKSVNNMLLSQMSKGFESYITPLGNKINQINSLFSRANQQKNIFFAMKSKMVFDLLEEIQSIVQSTVVDFTSGQGEDRGVILQRLELAIQKLEEVTAEFEVLSSVFLRERMLNSENLQKKSRVFIF